MSKLLFFKDLNDLNYKLVGLKCGLEIHQQLNCGKLFSSVDCNIVPNDTLDKKISRKLRFSLSETGEVDSAALNEFKKQKELEYWYNNDVASLVDLDEEPPKGPNKRALNTALKVGLMLNLSFFDKIQFMRKLIIDGSVTSGFQRTAMLGSFGYLDTPFGKVEIQGVNLEEDSCRNIQRTLYKNIFALDRQGIPLIEITTGPQIFTPNQAYDTAKQIGDILRSFKETKRGLGTIRQDLNVSIIGGARVEIKGAQNLKLIPQIIENEVKRQLIHKSIIEELALRQICADNFTDWEIYDVTNLFKNTSSQILLDNLKEKNSKIMAVKLFNFKNILGHELQENFRFGTEISNRNKEHFPQIKGLFHRDELPKYGITEKEVEDVCIFLDLKKQDSFILIANDKNIAKESLKNILLLISELITQVPSEVRQVESKGVITTFLRPMPGSARMYPETDIEEIELNEKSLNILKKELPELYSEKINRISKELNLDLNEVSLTLERFEEEEVKKLIQVSNKTARFIYQVVFEIPKDIKKRDKIEVFDLKFDLLCDLFKTVKDKNLSNSIIRDILVSLFSEGVENINNLSKYIEEKNLIGESISDEDIKSKVLEIIKENPNAPFGALMGKCMQAFNSKIDGKKISGILKELM